MFSVYFRNSDSSAKAITSLGVNTWVSSSGFITLIHHSLPTVLIHPSTMTDAVTAGEQYATWVSDTKGWCVVTGIKHSFPG